MNAIEKELREALALMDGVPVAGREHRARMSRAETKIYAVAETIKKLEEKEAGKNADNHDGQGSKVYGEVRAEHKAGAE